MKRYVLATLIVLTACKREYRSGDSALTATRAVDVVAQRAAEGLMAAPPPPPQPAAAAIVTPPAIRMMIRTATVSVVVRDAADALRRAAALVEARGGYVAEQREWKEHDQTRASATLRVPSAQLTAALQAIRGLAVRVDNEAITGQDVSQEFTDLGAQLKNLQATEAELRQLLTTVRQRTQKASEIMEVFSELTRVRGEIERIQGRMQYLSQMTAFSTITLDLIPDAIAAPVIEPGWQPQATAKAAARALTNTLKALADVAIWVALYVLPIALMFVVAALIIHATWRWRRSVVTRNDAA